MRSNESSSQTDALSSCKTSHCRYHDDDKEEARRSTEIGAE